MIVSLKLRPGESEEKLKKICEKKLHGACRHFKILKKSLDARDKGDIFYQYSIECDRKKVQEREEVLEKISHPIPQVFIAGAGPCGLFCALRLLKRGIVPIILERGRPVEERERDIRNFIEFGALDPSSNVQFGEGGAGAFSDGKLNTQTNSPYRREILKEFVFFGAPREIEYLSKPHIGSDNLKIVLKNMRNYLLENGAKIYFSARLEDVAVQNGQLKKIKVNGVWCDASVLVLAVGHSARDTFEMLLSRGFKVEQKEFAVGVRVEHLQQHINRAQYGSFAPLLPAADYKLTSHASLRAAFSFCMCPGGVVIPASSEEGGVVTNGMSNFLRNEKNANAALVVQVKRGDFGSEHPLAGVEYQRKLERAAYLSGGGGYVAPIQKMGDFLEKRNSSSFGEVIPSYARGTVFSSPEEYLPGEIISSLRAAIPDMDRRMKGFLCPDAILTGVESRTSSPVRILRDENLEAVNVKGVYPSGEGCGYAGGIASAAADGIKIAEAIFHLGEKP